MACMFLSASMQTSMQAAYAAPARTRAGEREVSLFLRFFFIAHGGSDSTTTTSSYHWDNLRSRLPVNGSRIRVGVRANPLSQVRVNRVAMVGRRTLSGLVSSLLGMLRRYCRHVE